VLNKDKINSETSQENTEEWDSLTYLTILTHLEKEFDIDINEKNINEFGSVKKIFYQIRQCQKN
jgi:acyl carrier protein